MNGLEIHDLDKLLKNYLGDSKKITDTKISRLTAAGENYGGILLKVDVTLKNEKNNTSEELHAVAKLIPEDEFFRQIFNIQVSSKVEIGFYDTMVPTFQKFQKEQGVEEVMDFFPKMYANRINLNGSDVVDEDAVLLLENLAESGFQNVNRFEGFDLPTIKIILKDLSVFHAVPLALKLLQPEVFLSKIKPYIEDHRPPVSENKGGFKGYPPSLNLLIKFLESMEECKSVIPKVHQAKIDIKEKNSCPRNEPFVSLAHGDLWVNNIMVKFEDGKPVANRFVDFQTPKYESPAMDLFFLLWSSVRQDVLEKHLDELVHFYHDCFIKQLKQLKCDVSPFSFENLEEELKSVFDMEMMHVCFMASIVIFYQLKESEDLNPELRKVTEIPDAAKERILFMIRTYKAKGWI